MSRAEELTEEQWAFIEHLLPELRPREDGQGRPQPIRALLEDRALVLFAQ